MSAWKSRDTRKKNIRNEDGKENQLPTMRPYHYAPDI